MASREIQNIEYLKFIWPAEAVGVGVDKGSYRSSDQQPEKSSIEEAVELAIKFRSEPGEIVFKNRQAMRVYEEVWKLLNCV